ncbi:hypothetical protein [Streptomyces meridianus]|uniref:Secreted protein n=1 Tax=Streptomyces meridianus TaxID=2938945 RepID=A0ABT0X383_9ACTN|nr:hypothetical protein [Streptomyces meridianus]MCM2576122.1 hypothetical protein [Streptomyces meridianus]
MRTLRKAAVVAVMVGSVGMFGAGAASAHGSNGGGGKAPGDFVVNNPQFLNCAYSGNSASVLSQITGGEALGDATQTMNLGNVCAQTGPAFES